MLLPRHNLCLSDFFSPTLQACLLVRPFGQTFVLARRFILSYLSGSDKKYASFKHVLTRRKRLGQISRIEELASIHLADRARIIGEHIIQIKLALSYQGTKYSALQIKLSCYSSHPFPHFIGPSRRQHSSHLQVILTSSYVLLLPALSNAWEQRERPVAVEPLELNLKEVKLSIVWIKECTICGRVFRGGLGWSL